MSAYGVCMAGGSGFTGYPTLRGYGVNWVRWASVNDSNFLNSGCNLLGTLIKTGSFTLADWQSFVSSTVNTRKNQIRVWEVWNEPTESTFKLGFDGTNYTYGASTASTQGYFNLLKAAYDIIKGIDPTLMVIGFGGMRVAYPNDPSKLHTDISSFFPQCVTLGALDYCDAMAIHAYPANSLDYTRMLQPASGWIKNFDECIRIMGSKQRPIWVTEWGVYDSYMTNSGYNKGQAMQQMYDIIKRYSTNTFWYKFKDDTETSGGMLKNMGLLDKNLNPKVVGPPLSANATMGDYFKTYVVGTPVIQRHLTLSSTPVVSWTINGSPDTGVRDFTDNSIINLSVPQKVQI